MSFHLDTRDRKRGKYRKKKTVQLEISKIYLTKITSFFGTRQLRYMYSMSFVLSTRNTNFIIIRGRSQTTFTRFVLF